MRTHNIQPTTQNSALSIAVFDSGFGGLTVLRALLPLIPRARYIYLGDTARLPYGAKSTHTVARYAAEAAQFLATQGADILVIACNTATALALPQITAAVQIPVIGVIAPVIKAAAAPATLQSPLPTVLVLATAATVQSHAYTHAAAALGLTVHEKACPLLVPLIEEGWIDHPVTRDVARIYLTEALAERNPATVILGCTHYPLIQPLLQQTLRDLGSPATIIDSAQATAQAVAEVLQNLYPERAPVIREPASPAILANCTFYATDSIEKFQRLGSAFLGQALPPVRLIDLGG